MIGADTNVLLRLVVDDDAAQHELAKQFFAARSANDPAHISLIVVAEFSWALRRLYAYDRDQIADVVLALLQSPDLIVERRDLVEEAAQLSRQPKVGLADTLIARLAVADGCRSVVTFDKDAAKRIPGMELLA